MNSRNARTWLFLLTSAILIIVSAGCARIPPVGDAWFHFQGVVTDKQGHPIEGAKLLIRVNGEVEKVATTDLQGHYSFDTGACPCQFSFKLDVSAPGFKPYTLTLNATEALALKVLNITLEQRDLLRPDQD